MTQETVAETRFPTNTTKKQDAETLAYKVKKREFIIIFKKYHIFINCFISIVTLADVFFCFLVIPTRQSFVKNPVSIPIIEKKPARTIKALKIIELNLIYFKDSFLEDLLRFGITSGLEDAEGEHL